MAMTYEEIKAKVEKYGQEQVLLHYPPPAELYALHLLQPDYSLPVERQLLLRQSCAQRDVAHSAVRGAA